MSMVLSALPKRVTGGLLPVSIIGCAVFAIPKPLHLAQRPGGDVPLLDVMAPSVVKVVFATMSMLIHFSLWSVPLHMFYVVCLRTYFLN